MPARFISNIDHALSKLKGGSNLQQRAALPPTGLQSGAPMQVAPGRRLAPSRVVHGTTTLPSFSTRIAQSQVIFTQPQFYSPLHTPQNWQIPSKRREIYQWNLINPCSVTSYDYTFKKIEDLVFAADEAIEDTITGGVLFELGTCEPIMTSSGNFSAPCRISHRQCIDKNAIKFNVWGYWRSLSAVAEHKQIWLDGRLYRKKEKLASNERYRRSNGIQVGKNKHTAWKANQLIRRGLASEVTTDDYLLYPVPNIGSNSMSAEDAWLIGNCAADGCQGRYKQSYSVRFTLGRDEPTRLVLENLLSDKFSSTIGSRPHGPGKGWRISVSTKNAWEFFSQYIVGKGPQKKFAPSVFELDLESRLNLLGGYLDGDGYFSPKGVFIAINYSKDMADQLYALLLSVGIRCSLGRNRVPENAYDTDSEWRYRILLSCADLMKIKPYMRGQKIPEDFSPKKERQLRFFYEEDGVKYFAQPIQSIEQYKYTGPGYDLQIDPERAFVANGFVTSNCRFFYENEPKVAAAIDFYSDFGMNGFELQCDDPKLLRLYQSVNRKLKLENKWCRMISRERHMLGDVFPFLEIECEHCHGSMVDKSGGACRHPHGTFRRLVILNPDWIDVQTNVMAEDPVITLLPDDELKRIVWHKQPRAIYDRIPNHVKTLILSGRPIPLDNNSVSHIKFNPYPYGVYGTSMIRRLFKILAYKDKLMTAQWIVAERLILPIRIVKVGNDERPAGPAEIADVQQQLAQVANDPNLTLVTHHAFDYEWVGCLSTDENNSYALTADGIKHFQDLTENDKIATWNEKTGKVEYQNYIRKVVFNYGPQNSEGYAFRIHTTDWNLLTTPNHRHYLEDGTVKRSDELVEGDVLLAQNRWGWEGVVPKKMPYKEREELSNFTLEEFCRLAGHYISEGHARREETKNLSISKQIQCFGISQSVGMPKYDDMKYLCSKISNTMWIHEDTRSDSPTHTFTIGNAELARWMASQFGEGCYDKHFPSWMLELPTRYLNIMLDALYAGNGNVSRIRYNTTSSVLRDQVCNILIKLSKTPRTYEEKGLTPVDREEYNIYRVSWPKDNSKNLSRKFRIKKIDKVPFNGKMWCLEMPNRNFFVKAGKQIVLTGNTSGKVLQLSHEYEFVNKEILQGLMINEALLSGEMPGYSSAAIGAEAIIRRIESWRRELSEWIEESIFRPIAQMKGFVDEEATKEYGGILGEPVWVYPKVKWNDLHLRDKTQHDQILLQLQERGLVSAQTTLEKLEYDYDQEVERIRYETAAQSVGQMGPGGMAGGGGMGGMGGDIGGGMGAPPPPGGGMPGGAGLEGGMEAGGAPGTPGGVPVGAPIGGPTAPGAAAAGPVGGTMGKIMPRSKSNKLQKPEEQEVQPSNIPLTSLEQKLYKTLVGMKLPFPSFAQYPLGPYRADFSIPALKLAIEADGDKWHMNPEAVAKDQRRDSQLAFYGWTVMRFSEREIKDRISDVEYTLTTVVNDLWRKALKRQEKMREMQEAASSVDGSQQIKLALVENLHRAALSTKEDIAKVKSKRHSLTGLLVESLLEEFDNKELRPEQHWLGYPAFDPSVYPAHELDTQEDPTDGQTDQGEGDPLD